MNIILIHTNRKSLLPHLKLYFEKVKNDNVSILKINKIEDLNKIEDDIKANKIDFMVFSNGSDNIDVKLKSKILNINPNQKLLFSENAWLTWQDFLYLDSTGIGSNSFIFNNFNFVNISKAKKDFVHDLVLKQTQNGKTIKIKDYVLVPLQVNNDSKLNIGSPHFKTIEEFIDHIIKIIPDDVKILFKNHPNNKNKAIIPKRHNVINITSDNYSRKSLIEHAKYVIGINTTFLIESIYFKKLTVAFGLDVFSNKNIVCEGFGKTHVEILKFKPDLQNSEAFIDLLISKQIPKKHIVEKYKAL